MTRFMKRRSLALDLQVPHPGHHRTAEGHQHLENLTEILQLLSAHLEFLDCNGC